MAVTRRGRPTKQSEPGARVSLGLKVTPEIKAKLDEAARHSGRTQSQEAELRLTESFRDQEIIERTLALAYGEQLTAIVLTLATVLKEGGPTWGFFSTSEASKDWLADPYAFDQAARAIDRILDAMRPEGDPATPKMALGSHQTEKLIGNAGEVWANTALLALAGFPHGSFYERPMARLRPLLGPIANRVRAFMARHFLNSESAQ
jgi:hypothetical protein